MGAVTEPGDYYHWNYANHNKGMLLNRGAHNQFFIGQSVLLVLVTITELLGLSLELCKSRQKHVIE